jgi:hypothetical protein
MALKPAVLGVKAVLYSEGTRLKLYFDEWQYFITDVGTLSQYEMYCDLTKISIFRHWLMGISAIVRRELVRQHVVVVFNALIRARGVYKVFAPANCYDRLMAAGKDEGWV